MRPPQSGVDSERSDAGDNASTTPSTGASWCETPAELGAQYTAEIAASSGSAGGQGGRDDGGDDGGDGGKKQSMNDHEAANRDDGESTKVANEITGETSQQTGADSERSDGSDNTSNTPSTGASGHDTLTEPGAQHTAEIAATSGAAGGMGGRDDAKKQIMDEALNRNEAESAKGAKETAGETIRPTRANDQAETKGKDGQEEMKGKDGQVDTTGEHWYSFLTHLDFLALPASILGAIISAFTSRRKSLLAVITVFVVLGMAHNYADFDWTSGGVVSSMPAVGEGSGSAPECKLQHRAVVRRVPPFADKLVPAYERSLSAVVATKIPYPFAPNAELVDVHVLSEAIRNRDRAVAAHAQDVHNVQSEIRDFLCRLKHYPTVPLPSSAPATMLSSSLRSLFVLIHLETSPVRAVVARARELQGFLDSERVRRHELDRNLSVWHGKDKRDETDAIFWRFFWAACRLGDVFTDFRTKAEKNRLTLERELEETRRSFAARTKVPFPRPDNNKMGDREASSRNLQAFQGGVALARHDEMLAQIYASDARIACLGAREMQHLDRALKPLAEEESDKLNMSLMLVRKVVEDAEAMLLPRDNDIRDWEERLAQIAGSYLERLREMYGGQQGSD